MSLTREWIDIVAPEHGRTSCNDDKVCNGHYNIDEHYVNGVIVSRTFDPPPRCNRCFLLDAMDLGFDSRIEVKPTITLSLKQPEFKIEQISTK